MKKLSSELHPCNSNFQFLSLPANSSLPSASSSSANSNSTSTFTSPSSPTPNGSSDHLSSALAQRVGSASLDLRAAPPSTACAVVHRALITDQQNSRRCTASTLTRGEVRGGGKKPYQQKKTGQARRGSQRTPLCPGGGVIFGPKPRDWSIKEKRLAISTALASAVSSKISILESERAKRSEI